MGSRIQKVYASHFFLIQCFKDDFLGLHYKSFPLTTEAIENLCRICGAGVIRGSESWVSSLHFLNTHISRIGNLFAVSRSQLKPLGHQLPETFCAPLSSKLNYQMNALVKNTLLLGKLLKYQTIRRSFYTNLKFFFRLLEKRCL